MKTYIIGIGTPPAYLLPKSMGYFTNDPKRARSFSTPGDARSALAEYITDAGCEALKAKVYEREAEHVHPVRVY